MTQFNRSASLIVDTAEGGSAVVIKNFRISFNIKKTEDKDPNTAKIEIYNLNEDTRNLIRLDEDPKTDQLVTLNAGYLDGDGEEVLFKGTMTSVYHQFKRPLVISVIEANDGKGALDKKKSSKSFSNNTSGKSVLNSLIGDLGLPSNINTLSFPDKIYKYGIAIAGMAKNALTNTTDFLDLSWSIQNNELKFVPFDGDDGTRAVLLTPSSGMLGSPERLASETRKAKKKTKKVKPGWRVDALLNAKIIPLGRIGLSSREIPADSIFIVKSVSHTGDTHGTVWKSTVEAREL